MSNITKTVKKPTSVPAKAVNVPVTKSTPAKTPAKHVTIQTSQTKPGPSQAEAASTQKNEKLPEPTEINLKAINGIIFSEDNKSVGKWPLMIDPSERVSAFLRHRDTNMLNAMDLDHMIADKVRIKLISAIRYSKPFVIGNFLLFFKFSLKKKKAKKLFHKKDLMDADKTLLDNIKLVFAEINPNLFDELCSKELLEKEKYMYLVKPEDGDDFKSHFWNEEQTKKFMTIFLTSNESPSEALLKITTPYKIV